MNRTLVGAGSLLIAMCGSAYGVVACGDDSATAGTTDGGTSPDATTKSDAASAADAGSPLDAGGTLGDGGPVSVAIHFKAKVGTQDFHCGTTYTAQGATGEPVEPQDLRFYVQDVRLVDAQGKAVPVTLDTRSPWQTPQVALLDFENGTGACSNGNVDLNDVVTGTVPAGTYTGIIFTNGVPDSLNHADPTTAPAPLQAGEMTWGWLYGYKFIKAEMLSKNAPLADAGRGIGLLHIGSVGCDNSVDGGDPDFNKGPTVACTQPNRNEVHLGGFSAASSAIVLDVAALFAATDLSADSQCHSEGPACVSMFANVGVSFATGAKLPSQSAFRVE